MKTIVAVLAFACAGCEVIFGIGDTKLAPDASVDAQPDAFEAPTIAVGNGKDGPLVVAQTVYTDEVRTPMTSAVGAGSTLVSVASSDGFAVDDEVLVIQMTGADAGQSDARYIKGTTATSLTLDRALTHSYQVSAESAVQLVRVPNYTDVTVPADARLTAHAWDGATGGVVFFRVNGTLRIAAGGTVDAVGGNGGEPGASIPATAGGQPGLGASRVNCPVLGCGTDLFAPGGGFGDFNFGMLGGPGVQNNKCFGGPGGRGGRADVIIGDPLAGNPGGGPGGGAVPGAGGTYLSQSSTRPMIGGGGAGGTGSKGGAGAGGGGGGGAPIAAAGGGTNGVMGTAGEAGGAAGTSGVGGIAGGIVWIHANAIENDGSISVAGADGVAGGNGGDGGKGGDGGAAGEAFTFCNGAKIDGGLGGGGTGGYGGDGGNGGGGGAGGTLIIEAFTVKTNGTLRGRGGAGNGPTTGGLAGLGGTGFGGDAPAGMPGTGGVGGLGGADGRIYIFYVDDCTSCESAADPTASIMAK